MKNKDKHKIIPLENYELINSKEKLKKLLQDAFLAWAKEDEHRPVIKKHIDVVLINAYLDTARIPLGMVFASFHPKYWDEISLEFSGSMEVYLEDIKKKVAKFHT